MFGEMVPTGSFRSTSTLASAPCAPRGATSARAPAASAPPTNSRLPTAIPLPLRPRRLVRACHRKNLGAAFRSEVEAVDVLLVEDEGRAQTHLVARDFYLSEPSCGDARVPGLKLAVG